MSETRLSAVALAADAPALEQLSLSSNGSSAGHKPVALASVIIPTHNRPDDLRRCLVALARQVTGREFEVVVVDDGSSPPVLPGDITHCPSARLLRLKGVGPAKARNAGVAEARGDALLFTDDDTEPEPTWIEAACEALDAHGELVAVEGPVVSPSVDYLYGYTVQNRRPGGFLTCNIGYRRVTFEALEGFCELFPFAHCEDLDMGFRAAELGPVGFTSEMTVTHHPRDASLWELARRGRFISSEYVLHSRHPSLYRPVPVIPWRLQPVFNIARRWFRALRRDRGRLSRSPARLARLLAVAAAQLAVAFVTALRSGEASRYTRDAPDSARRGGPPQTG